jgi:hypothetical protein
MPDRDKRNAAVTETASTGRWNLWFLFDLLITMLSTKISDRHSDVPGATCMPFQNIVENQIVKLALVSGICRIVKISDIIFELVGAITASWDPVMVDSRYTLMIGAPLRTREGA